ncbi:MAG: formate hydrogenlyase maturation protein HycH [Bacteroidota bacterium]
MADRVVFYQLTHKYVSEAVPEGPRQVIYYSLSIGHHVGVMDCLQPLMEMPLERYRSWLTCIPKGEGRRKLEGLLRWGEIEINRAHADDLLPALREALPAMNGEEIRCTTELIECLETMIREPALYLMVRRRS